MRANSVMRAAACLHVDLVQIAHRLRDLTVERHLDHAQHTLQLLAAPSPPAGEPGWRRCTPSWPRSFAPAAYAWPSAQTTNECDAPQDKSTTFVAAAWARTRAS